MPLFYYCPWGWMPLDEATSNAIAECNAEAAHADQGPSISLRFALDSIPAHYGVRVDWDGNVHQAWLEFNTRVMREVRNFPNAAAARRAHAGYNFRPHA